VTRFVGFLLFLVFAQDQGFAYDAYLGHPLGWVHDYLLEPTPIKLRPFDLIMLVCLLSKAGGKGASAPPMKKALLLILATTATWFAYGMLRGGDVRFASWQTYLVLSTVLVAFTVGAVFRTPADYEALAKWLIAAASYHALMCWISFFTWAVKPVGGMGLFLTCHDDTILWVVSILILIVSSLNQRSPVAILRNVALILFFMAAIQFNSRRLAWVSLTLGLGVLYLLFPAGPAKTKINRIAKLSAPVALLYVVIGWGRQNPLFLPLRAFSSVTTKEDASTLARNVENLGLIATGNGSSFFMGTGWGVPYTPVSLKYDISSFELWQYIPHNSVLGLLAFTGALGFAGVWLAIPTAAFLLARVARFGNDTRARTVGIIGAAELLVCGNQLYGDMGIFSAITMYTMAASFAMALRLPVAAGVWGAPKARAPRRRA
jgi:hypothetical protein